jgi:hypothetical protein
MRLYNIRNEKDISKNSSTSKRGINKIECRKEDQIDICFTNEIAWIDW